MTQCTEKDSGVYSFNVGVEKTSSKLTVEMIGITEQLKNLSMKETQRITLECKVSHPDLPLTSYKWMKNGVKIEVNRLLT